jgi:deferrochelatase/peroxidase EfeB
VLKWSQLGFGRASATGAGQTTPGNLMGFKDGTNNIRADDAVALDEQVWVAQGPGWMAGGSYLVARKIRMGIETWDTDPRSDQERIFGRNKTTGAPITGGDDTPFDFGKTTASGAPVIDVDAHTRLASPEQNGGIRVLRRGYNYTDGQDPDTGKLAAGLFFTAFQRDPQTQFKALQTRLGALRPAERMHRAHRRRALGLPTRGERSRRLVRQGPVRLAVPMNCSDGEQRSSVQAIGPSCGDRLCPAGTKFTPTGS